MERPKLKRDWIGLTVKTLRQIETKGGTIFPKGTLMKVNRNFGGLHLEAVTACRKCRLQYRHTVKGVSERDVVIIERK